MTIANIITLQTFGVKIVIVMKKKDKYVMVQTCSKTLLSFFGITNKESSLGPPTFHKSRKVSHEVTQDSETEIDFSARMI